MTDNMQFDDDRPDIKIESCKEPGAAWMNWFLFQRKGVRGDLVATISFLCFILLITCTVFGGSEFTIFGQTIKITAIDWKASIALVTVIIGYITKSALDNR